MVGATLACLLAKSGKSVAVIEAYKTKKVIKTSPYELRVSAISRTSQQALVDAGAWENIVKQRVSPYEEMTVWDAEGDGKVNFNAAQLVRSLSGIEIDREDYAQSGLVAVVKTEKHHQYTAWQRFQQTGPLAFLPLSDGSCSIVWTLPSDRADYYLSRTDDDFKQALAEAFDYKLGEITEVSQRAAFPLRGSQAKEYVKPRIALVGDAAHTIHPLAGQGVNLGIKDAVELARILLAEGNNSVVRDVGTYKVLRRYERARRGDNLLTMKQWRVSDYYLVHTASPVKTVRNMGKMGLPIEDQAKQLLSQIDFNETLMQGMLSALLFAGALHVHLEELIKQKWVVAILASVGVIASTFMIGFSSYYIFAWLGLDMPLIYCLLFGSLISPTDPIAVIGILKTVGAPKSLETKIAGESLFNDGVAVVVFLVLLSIAGVGGHGDHAEVNAMSVISLFAQEALGGAIFGIAIGYIAYRMLSSIDNYQVEVLITLGLVFGGYALASALHVSGPIAIVVAGLLIGNKGRKFAMSDKTREHLDNFWELIDEILNAVLFVLIGLEVLVLSFEMQYLWAGLIMIVVTLLSRFIAVGLPVSLMKLRRTFTPNIVKIMTWGGLRGGISIALVLTLPPGENREALLMITYIIVIFSILVQGLTVGKLVPKH
ncbi:Na(+)/H(+) antiporter NhaP [Nymphon striatum]|nr:Na(+)/H(+) antiporter NhaP [Nymphon striatum]